MKIPVSHGWLEAVLKEPDDAARGAAVVCHPHPLHGGTMHTKAVYRAAQALNEAGLVALRFNFRGIGTSTGSHEGGVGEREDVHAALDWLETHYPTLPLVCGGFSFGSMVGLGVGVDDARVVSLLGFGLPVGKAEYDYGYLASADKPVLVVQGEDDEFGSGACGGGGTSSHGAPHHPGPDPRRGPLLHGPSGATARDDPRLLRLRAGLAPAREPVDSVP